MRAIVLRVDSPGGSGTASDAIWREVGARSPDEAGRRLDGGLRGVGRLLRRDGRGRDRGPAGHDHRLDRRLLRQVQPARASTRSSGVSQETVRRGKNATLFSSWEPWTDEERAKVRGLNVAFYETFVAKAAEGRKKTPQEIDAVAQGRVWTGEEALAAGLVDALGGLDAARAPSRGSGPASPKGQEVQIVVLPQRKGLLETLLERQDEDVLVARSRARGRVVPALGDGARATGGRSRACRSTSRSAERARARQLP